MWSFVVCVHGSTLINRIVCYCLCLCHSRNLLSSIWLIISTWYLHYGNLGVQTQHKMINYWRLGLRFYNDDWPCLWIEIIQDWDYFLIFDFLCFLTNEKYFHTSFEFYALALSSSHLWHRLLESMKPLKIKPTLFTKPETSPSK